MPSASPVYAPTLLLAIAAATAPSLLAWSVSPSPTFLNQALALALWGLFVAAAALAAPAQRLHRARPAWALHGALGLVAIGALWSWGPGALPSGLALSALGLLAAAALLAQAGAAARGSVLAQPLLLAFCVAWMVAGVLNAGIGAVQVFAPEGADGDWIVRSHLPGRAVGNLRQPNHVSSLLLWSAIALVALLETVAFSRAGRAGRHLGFALFALMVVGVVLTASRTGVVGVALLALWGLLDRRLSRPVRALLIAAPVIYALAWWGLAAWAQAGAHGVGGAERLAEVGLSTSRYDIWSNTLALIRAQPWAGVGFGDFNFAWTLTPFPGRPIEFFDHAHNLPLQLAVELGLPLASLVMALLLWALRQGWRRSAGDTGARCALMMVLMIGLHSLLEYPLWYAYFLLPAAWAWGYAIGQPAGAAPPLVAAGVDAVPLMPRPASGRLLGGVVLAVAAGLSVADYARVAVIFSAASDAAPLARRIAAGQSSLLFAHHADYAAATAGAPPPPEDRAFVGATHYLLDTRLMTAWFRALAASGRPDEARHIAARLREFERGGESGALFAPCAEPASAALALQCSAPARRLGWRDFVAR